MKRFTAEAYIQGILSGDRVMLSRAITLVESTLSKDRELASEVLDSIQKHTGNSFRIGLTGVPGVGKSTFIEAFGLHLIGLGHRVAVLTVDPSSSLSKGSILGDKTRMDELSRSSKAYIRPSAAGSTLGGTALHTRESILLCEAAGYDRVIVETVGVGQSETLVDSMVDFFLLLMLAGAGDELQGIKRGIMELAHSVVINKADGDNLAASLRAKAEYSAALHWLSPRVKGWQTPVQTCSALKGDGITEIATILKNFQEHAQAQGILESRRAEQRAGWFKAHTQTMAFEWLNELTGMKALMERLESQVSHGEVSLSAASYQLEKALKSSIIK